MDERTLRNLQRRCQRAGRLGKVTLDVPLLEELIHQLRLARFLRKRFEPLMRAEVAATLAELEGRPGA